MTSLWLDEDRLARAKLVIESWQGNCDAPKIEPAALATLIDCIAFAIGEAFEQGHGAGLDVRYDAGEST